MMKTNNNFIKIVGSDNCKDCSMLFNLIKDYIEQNNLNIKIQKLFSLSNEAIDLAIDFDINTIPFAIFNNKKIVFNKKTSRDELDDFFI